MKRMLFTIPDALANEFQQLVPQGERSNFIVRYLEIPLRELKLKKKKNGGGKKLNPKLIRDLEKSRQQAERGEVYSEEEVMREFGLL